MLANTLKFLWKIENVVYNYEPGPRNGMLVVNSTAFLIAVFGFLFGMEAVTALGMAMAMMTMLFTTLSTDSIADALGKFFGPVAVYVLASIGMTGLLAYVLGFADWMNFPGVLHFPYSRLVGDVIGFVLPIAVFYSLNRDTLTEASLRFGYRVGARADGSYGVT